MLVSRPQSVPTLNLTSTSIQTCPPELIDRVLEFIVPFEFPMHISPTGRETLPDDMTTTLVACSAACRTLSSATRPYIFRHITLYSRAQVKRFLALVAANRRILSWVKQLTLKAASAWIDTRSLIHWLGSHACHELLSRLVNVSALDIHNLHSTESSGKYDPILEQLWINLGCLSGSLTSLLIEHCEVPIWASTVELLTELYPQLTTLSLTYIYSHRPAASGFQAPSITSSSKIHLNRLKTLILWPSLSLDNQAQYVGHLLTDSGRFDHLCSLYKIRRNPSEVGAAS
jgi:hypothetical protein